MTDDKAQRAREAIDDAGEYLSERGRGARDAARRAEDQAKGFLPKVWRQKRALCAVAAFVVVALFIQWVSN